MSFVNSGLERVHISGRLIQMRSASMLRFSARIWDASMPVSLTTGSIIIDWAIDFLDRILRQLLFPFGIRQDSDLVLDALALRRYMLSMLF